MASPQEYLPSSSPSLRNGQTPRSRASTGFLYAARCENCFNWRLIPTKEKYEELRQNILSSPFICESARDWRPDVSCALPTDVSQDDSMVWAIDEPNIPQTPPGWERLIIVRSAGCTKFADVYYVSPSGKKLRSTVETRRYLLEHQEMYPGVNLDQFSFKCPKPLRSDYVRRRGSVPPSGSNRDEPTEVISNHWRHLVDNSEDHIPGQWGFLDLLNHPYLLHHFLCSQRVV